MSDEWAETDEWPLPRYTGSSKVPATFHPGDGLVWRDRGEIIAAQQARIAQLEAQAIATQRALDEAAAIGWDACAASIVYEDGTPVDVVRTVNPYRKALS